MPQRKLVVHHTSSDSFIVEWCSQILHLRRFISPHWWLRKLNPSLEDSYRFVDSWVFGHFLGSMFLFLATSAQSLRWLEWIAVGYGGIIVIEGFFYEVDLLMFGGYRKAKKGEWYYVLSHRRLVVTSLLNYVAIIFWFAMFYRHWTVGFRPIPPDRLLTWLRLSFHTMTSFGNSPVAPCDGNTWTILLTLAQSAIGVFMGLLIVVSFVRLLPEPGTRTPFEGKPPPYDPEAEIDDSPSRRSFWMSKMSRESLTLAAAIGAFALSALSLFLGYSVLVSLAPGGGYVTHAQCAVGVLFVVFGMGMTIGATKWLKN